MGYTTEFYGSIDIDPPLNEKECEFLMKFANTRRMKREKGPYFVDGTGWAGQGNDPDIISFNDPPDDQPGLWCKWIPSKDGASIEWSGAEKFYSAAEWMAYLIEHFLKGKPKAKKELKFLQGHICNGTIEARGEDHDDRWQIEVVDNKVYKSYATEIVYTGITQVTA